MHLRPLNCTFRNNLNGPFCVLDMLPSCNNKRVGLVGDRGKTQTQAASSVGFASSCGSAVGCFWASPASPIVGHVAVAAGSKFRGLRFSYVIRVEVFGCEGQYTWRAQAKVCPECLASARWRPAGTSASSSVKWEH